LGVVFGFVFLIRHGVLDTLGSCFGWFVFLVYHGFLFRFGSLSFSGRVGSVDFGCMICGLV
jgi:hypothetical protein